MTGDARVDEFRSKGIRENGSKVFTVEFTGRQIYTLFTILESLAKDSRNYMVIKDAVQMVEFVREQVRGQDW